MTSATVNTTGVFTVPEGQGGPGEALPGDTIEHLPAYCDVEVTLTNPPAHDHIGVGIWLPLTWNGRFEGVGGGGFVSGISWTAMGGALRGGYATASTDTGHPAAQGDDGSFAMAPDGTSDWPVIEDFADRAVHEMTVTGKAATATFYGAAAHHTYFEGCSMGGRQALAEAQRYPTDYDGIAAGSTAVDFPRLSAAQLWPQFVMLRAHDFLPQCKFAAFQQAVIAKCDDLDKVTDGVIADLTNCHFDPRTLVGTPTPCGTITPNRRDGHDPDLGRPTHAGRPPPLVRPTVRLRRTVPGGNLSGRRRAGRKPRLFTKGVTRFDALEDDNPNLTAFHNHGGKLLLWTGLADSLIPPEGTIDYYNAVVRRMGGPQRTASWTRLFLAPGVGHCAGRGTIAPAPTDHMTPLTTWVEHGRAPASLLATTVDPTTGEVTATRPTCAYPSVAHYNTHGPTNDAHSYRCARTY